MKVGFGDIALAALAGLLMALAAPLVVGAWSDREVFATPLNEVLAWVALVPLFFAIDGKRGRPAFVLGAVAGVVYFGITLYWVTVALTVFGRIPYIGAVPLVLLLVAYCALYWAAGAWLCGFVKNALGAPFSLSAPVLFAALELLRNYLLSGFPWGSIGYTQHRNLAIIQVASIAGVYGVTFLVVLGSALFYEWIGVYLRRRMTRPVVSTAAFAALVVGAFVWGAYRSEALAAAAKKAPAVKVSVLQGNIGQGVKNEAPIHRRSIASVYNRLTVEADARGSDLIVWPEAAYPVLLPRSVPGFATDWSLLRLKTAGAHILMGAGTYHVGPDRTRRLGNSAFLLDPSLSVLGRYDKTHLVPFGEYVPLGLPVEKLVSGLGVYVPGPGPEPLSFSRGDMEVRAGVLICYEGIFPEIARSFVQRGANLLVNLTNDAWYGVSSAPYQHLSMYVFRAIETGRYVARAANTGISAFVDPYGRILARSEIFTEDDLTATVPLLAQKTVYTRMGDLFAYAAAAVALALLTAASAVSRQKPRE
ncbi:MAG: apolipoprotein N-acyltransferase [Deltaproteobacteria bacterium]|nr:apolipoprotein N-acyltransferase [Deltaproteobacteria bacterium]